MVNKGDGFEFFAHIRTGNGKIVNNNYIKLATFNLNTSSSSGEDRYKVTYNQEIFDEMGLTNEGYSLKYYSDSGIQFKIVNRNKETITDMFAIRPLKNNIRPGDDIALNFSISIDNVASIAQADFSSQLAVYDKKMLWRANLYIDEGNDDWNIENPWNSPSTGIHMGSFKEIYRGVTTTTSLMKLNNKELEIDGSVFVWYGINEWNRIMSTLNDNDDDGVNVGANSFRYTAGSNRWEDLTLLKEGDGRQVTKIPETYYYSEKIANNGTPNLYKNKKVKDSVVYNLFRTTTPFEFFYQMQQQNLAMKNRESLVNGSLAFFNLREAADNAKFNLDNATNENRRDLKAIYKNALIELKEGISKYTDIGESTLAPENNWQNYIAGSFRPSLKDFTKYDNDLNNNYNSLKITLPFQQPLYNNLLEVDEAGVDCGGLIYAAEMYDGTPYMSNSTTSARTGKRVVHDCDTVGIEGNPWGDNKNLWFIKQKSNLEDDEDTEESLAISVIPGDIIYYREGLNYHVMIVQNVDIKGNPFSATSKDIHVIESTWGVNVEPGKELFGVGKLRDLGADYLFAKNWIIGRLITK